MSVACSPKAILTKDTDIPLLASSNARDERTRRLLRHQICDSEIRH
jgi:hypothetical protein